ncbi:MAG: LysR family transcriptional regulator [Methanomassiliicoccales archaeon]|nr:MAG: LysR family transcriptional regulator [Methanomassiliicoccales archaeon]
MKILPDLRLTVNDVTISMQQIKALFAIASTHSQNKAASILEISVPVLHRSLKDMEKKLGLELITTTHRGTRLTEEGKDIIEAYERYKKRMMSYPNTIVACSPLYFNLVQKIVSAIEREGYQIDLLVSDDDLNNHCLEMGLVGAVVFDDPIYIYKEKEAQEIYEVVEVIKDTLIHVYRGNKYLRYKFGAQRIGFSHIKAQGVKYEVVGMTRDTKFLLKSGHSFFINRSLARREGLALRSRTEPKLLMHSIFALRMGKGEELDALMLRLGQIK